MTDKRIQLAEAPRRGLFRLAAGAASLVAGGLAAGPAAAAPKMAQPQVHYQTGPNGAQRCRSCIQFLPAPACKLVADPISPDGWCVLYAAKSN